MAVTLVVVIAGIVVAIQWAKGVMREAKEIAEDVAKTEAERIANERAMAYLNEKVPGLVADAIAAMTEDAGKAISADDQAEALGGEPG